MRRSRKQLEEAITKVKSGKEKALAYYNLGLFHDNNGREGEAIPNYHSALKLGLNVVTRAKALAWLASSLYKTGKPKQALKKISELLGVAKDVRLKRFLIRLKGRITRDPNKFL